MTHVLLAVRTLMLTTTILLAPGLVRKALANQGNSTGLETGRANTRYAMGFWHQNVAPLLGCSKDYWLAYMSGYGGITLLLAPGDLAYYTVKDNFDYDINDAIRALHEIAPICQ